jgi:hypothetical protein
MGMTAKCHAWATYVDRKKATPAGASTQHCLCCLDYPNVFLGERTAGRGTACEEPVAGAPYWPGNAARQATANGAGCVVPSNKHG